MLDSRKYLFSATVISLTILLTLWLSNFPIVYAILLLDLSSFHCRTRSTESESATTNENCSVATLRWSLNDFVYKCLMKLSLLLLLLLLWMNELADGRAIYLQHSEWIIEQTLRNCHAYRLKLLQIAYKQSITSTSTPLCLAMLLADTL